MNYFKASETHKTHYEVCGNQNTELILFVYGKSGARFSEHDKLFFNFDKQNDIFFDQRGAPKSILLVQL